MIPLKNNPNVDNSDLLNYPDGRVKDNTGTGNGTPVNRSVYGDVHSNISKLMRLYNIIPNELPDNETNQYQIIEALRSLATKNDFVLDINSVSGVLGVNVKIGSMLEKEQIVCKALVDWTSETTIKGSDNVTLAFTKYGNFKVGEYVRLIKTASAINIIRLGDSVSIGEISSELGFLKKATQSEENAGIIDTKATTPLANKNTFSRRVNGVDSNDYLATVSQNGLMSASDKAIIDSFDSGLKNKGFISGIDIDSGSGSYPVGGNIASASIITSSGKRQVILVTMSNPMSNTDYEVQTTIQSQASFASDVEIHPIVFKPISVTQFQLALRETMSATTQNLKIHCRVYQL